MFIVLLTFSDNKEQAGAHMDGHKQWIKQGFDEGIFLVAGSIKPKQGGMIIAHNLSMEALQEKVDHDPFVMHNIVKAEILEIDPSLVDARLQFLLANQ